MKTITKNIKLNINYDLNLIEVPEKIAFFDIETTGLSPENSELYIIGVLVPADNSALNNTVNFKLTQFFSESISDELDLIKAFFKILEKCKALIHFNGDRFDIPYIKKVCAHYNIEHPFDQIKSLDIYKIARRKRIIINSFKFNQKSLEQFLGIKREDRFSGKELIDIYNQYLINYKYSFFESLVLHNKEDLTGLVQLLPILSYKDFIEGEFKLISKSINQDYLEAVFESEYYIPKPFRIKNNLYSVNGKDNIFTLRCRLYTGEAKFFFNNYKDYYYLPLEDMAVHKSIGNFVDKSVRKNAVKSTAYIKKNSTFLPACTGCALKTFYKKYNDKTGYFELEDFDFNNKDLITSFIKGVFSMLSLI